MLRIVANPTGGLSAKSVPIPIPGAENSRERLDVDEEVGAGPEPGPIGRKADDEAWVGRGAKEQMVDNSLVRAGRATEFFRQGEGDHEVVDRQQQVLLILEPFVGLIVLALGTVPWIS